ncbi:MAG: DmsE family decaheme c-type cytochrome [Thiotrichales bacterium]
MSAAAADDTYIGSEMCIDCHGEQHTRLLATRHGVSADSRTPIAREGCEGCHGPGMEHAASGGAIIGFGHGKPTPAEAQNAQCLQCHEDTRRIHWQGSAHAAADLSCADCHRAHHADLDWRSSAGTTLCQSCHPQVRAELLKASAHPVRQGGMACVDCHGAHGTAGPSALRALTLNQSCHTCHPEKRGPFLWEHEPASDDCSHCHLAHGSNHPALLKFRTPLLCQQCHQTAGSLSVLEHVRTFADNRAGSARFVAGLGCLNCHAQVHGSNHPSGAAFLR